MKAILSQKVQIVEIKKKTSSQRKAKSSYGKYKCQYKQKPILTKLNSDSGYPQQILQSQLISSHQSNYVQENKKNLKNFFRDRIPPENTLLNRLMKRDLDMINPKRIFQIKQLQYELKTKTKLSLKNTFSLDLKSGVSQNFQKVEDNFHINDKNKELQQQYTCSKQIYSYYDKQHYRRGTKSHIQKRSKILKKQAYDKVFGPDISAVSRTTLVKPPEPLTPPRAGSISLAESVKNKSNTQNLRSLIEKMHDYKNRLEESHQILQLKQAYEPNNDCEQNMINLIQNIKKYYQTRTISQGTQKLESLEDLGKLDFSYYEEMISHKNNRLSKRKQLVSHNITLSPPSTHRPHSPATANTFRMYLDHQSDFSANQPNELDLQTIPVQQSSQLGNSFLNTAKYRFKLLKKSLVRWAALFYIYGIQKANIFLAFRTKNQPYGLEGSYAFFKCIKMGDLEAVQTFLQRDSAYVFQQDFNGKTVLSYAVQLNQTDIVRLILQVGVNSDNLCNNSHTSLYYSLIVRNVDIVRMLLQKGACPWSTAKNPYGVMVKQGKNSKELSTLFNNARKVYLGMQIQKTIQKRKQYWSNNYQTITEDRIIHFQRPA